MKNSGLNRAGISPAHARNQRNRKCTKLFCLFCVTLFISGFLCTEMIGHSAEDQVRKPAASGEMQLNQFRNQTTAGGVAG